MSLEINLQGHRKLGLCCALGDIYHFTTSADQSLADASIGEE
jgi:hypothetical protein